MTGEVFVDTAAWVALFDARDRSHEQAARIWSGLSAVQTQLVTTDYILDETLTFLLTHEGHAVSMRAGHGIFESRATRLLFLDEEAIRTSWDRYGRIADKGWSFTDVTSFVTMEHLGIRQAFTFDRHFAQAGFHIVG